MFYLVVVTTCKWLLNPITNLNPVSSMDACYSKLKIVAHKTVKLLDNKKLGNVESHAFFFIE